MKSTFLVLIPALLLAVVGVAAFSMVGRDTPKEVPAAAPANEPARPIAANEKADAAAFDVLIPADKAAAAPTFSPGDWINSDTLDIKGLKGKVVFVDFWTFGCYNCRNTLPSVKAFDDRYREKGLAIVGVHTPESGYEKKLDNVRSAVKENGIKYPVVTDVAGDTWTAYGVNAWPTVVIVDKAGRIRYRHVGEGAYDVQEEVIKQLLDEN